MESKMSGHWTDDQLIAQLYGVGPANDHLQTCAVCQSRLAAMESRRAALDVAPTQHTEVSAEFLAAQRRQIYARIAQPVRWWSGANVRRLASATATLLVLAGGLMVYEEHHDQQLSKESVSDAQLAAEVSSMTQDSEPSSTAPLQALFDE